MLNIKKKITALGLMSGTSMDGIDGAIINSNGCKESRGMDYNISKYNNITKKLLFNALNNISSFLKDKDAQNELSYKVTIDHASAAEDLINLSNTKPEVVGFHGQTIFHDSSKKKTLQLGDGKLLSELLKINVVSNFRDNDVVNGGEGAPLAPIYHKFLITYYDLDLPSCIINLGGVGNITYYDGIKLIGFDTGPGNGLMDSYMKKFIKKDYDNDGILSSKGTVDKILLKEFLKDKYFIRTYPKSLDRNHFQEFVAKLLSKNLSHMNSLATLAEFTIESICISIDALPKKPKQIIIVGGGSKNKHLVERLKIKFGKSIYLSEDIGFSSTTVEAELIAFLAIRRLHSLPVTFPMTTGVDKPAIGGVIHKF